MSTDGRVVGINVCKEGDEGVEARVADHPPEFLDLQHFLPLLVHLHLPLVLPLERTSNIYESFEKNRI